MKMKKTLFCENERNSNFELPTYRKVTAEKVDEVESGVLNLYRDELGNEYIVRYNNFKRRNEFVLINK